MPICLESNVEKVDLMETILVTGSCGLIGSETVLQFAPDVGTVYGVDNDMRRTFFGDDASTQPVREFLEASVKNYRHVEMDIRDDQLGDTFRDLGQELRLIVHTAAQPSHDWAAREPLTDFTINALGTLKLLEWTRRYCPDAVFIFMSTNKVYGDRPNSLPLQELETRWDLPADHPCHDGIDESMSIDHTLHSVFGASKAAADLMVQEYGRYFGMKTACLRGGCLTGPRHAGAELHGFLAYLMKCCITGKPYRIFGYKGKQVRDNIHASDLVAAIRHLAQAPRHGEVYNLGGGRANNCSMMEAISLCEEVAGRKMNVTYVDQPRAGDHIWYISDLRKLQSHYPEWRQQYTIRDTLEQMLDHQKIPVSQEGC